jgi:hypothetical protein
MRMDMEGAAPPSAVEMGHDTFNSAANELHAFVGESGVGLPTPCTLTGHQLPTLNAQRPMSQWKQSDLER